MYFLFMYTEKQELVMNYSFRFYKLSYLLFFTTIQYITYYTIFRINL
jgi:hypothetical protein